MTKTNIILKTLALMMALCMLFSVVACNKKTEGGESSDNESTNLNYGDAVDDDDEDDVVVNSNASGNNSGTSSKNDGKTSTPTGTSSKNDGKTSTPSGTSSKNDGKTSTPSGTSSKNDGKTSTPSGTSSKNDGKTSTPTQTSNPTQTSTPTQTSKPTPTESSKPADIGNISSGAENVDVNARQEFFDSIPDELSGKTVKLMVWWTRDDNAWEGDKFDDLEKETGIEVEYITTGAPNEGDYYTKLKALILQKNAPDIACIDGGNFPTVVAQDYFQPLSVARLDYDDPVYDTDLMDAYKYKGEYYSAVIKSTCVPAELRCLYYNKDMFDQYGVQTPLELYKAKKWNWDELIRIGTEMQKETKEQTQLSVDYGGRQIVLSCGEDVIMLNDGTPVNNFKSETVRKAWQFNSDLQYKYNMIASGSHQQFIEGIASMALAADYNGQSGGYFEQKIGDDFEWGIVPVPSPSASSIFVPTHVKGYGIPKNAKNPVAAGFVIRYWLDDSMNRPGSTTWYNAEVGDMIHHIWDLAKSPDYSFGVMNYAEPNAGMGGSYGSMAGEMSSVTAANIATVFDKWSGTADNKIDQIKTEAVN